MCLECWRGKFGTVALSERIRDVFNEEVTSDLDREGFYRYKSKPSTTGRENIMRKATGLGHCRGQSLPSKVGVWPGAVCVQSLTVGKGALDRSATRMSLAFVLYFLFLLNYVYRL